MNKSIIVLTVALGVGAAIALAQDAGGGRRGAPGGQGGPGGFGGGPGGPGGGHPMPAIINALDTNKDGKLDATEIANASIALKTLDKNGDGELTADEMFGARPAGGPGQPPPQQ